MEFALNALLKNEVFQARLFGLRFGFDVIEREPALAEPAEEAFEVTALLGRKFLALDFLKRERRTHSSRLGRFRIGFSKHPVDSVWRISGRRRIRRPARRIYRAPSG